MSVKLLFVLPLLALGGWATISVKELPEYIVTGQATRLPFTVRQHGVSPLNGLHPTIEARSGAVAATAHATPVGNGEYTAVVTLNQPGDWTITINSGFGNSRVTLLPIRVVDAAGQKPVALTDEQRGERLFTAKGCTTCHVDIEVGPKLQGRSFDPDFLRRWLADPAAIRPGTRMPNMSLTAAEIQALTAFLNRSTHGD